MIFVTVGTNEAPFDRLLEAVAALPSGEELVVQHGASAVRVPGATVVDFLPFEQIVENVRRARVVVTHAGVGSIIVALSNGKRPVVVPRLKQFGEAVDDHQLSFGRRFADAGLVTFVESPGDLGGALGDAEHVAPQVSGAGALAADLRSFLEQELAGSSVAAPSHS
jgi:UDP-N-acetylglucosamine transferase subunit ALG13